MDNSPTFDKEFLDLLLLSKAKVIYRIHKGKMYYSGFPLTAGMIGNVEVKTIEIKWEKDLFGEIGHEYWVYI